MHSVDTFRQHIISKTITLGEQAKRLYGNMTYDTALPKQFVDDMASDLGVPQAEVTRNFVWLYTNSGGQAAPLSEKGCVMLEVYHLGSEWDEEEDVSATGVYDMAMNDLAHVKADIEYTVTYAGKKSNRLNRILLRNELTKLLAEH
ncbi:MAG: hypothetical protein MAG431_02030 [Chloroflexi bacterium]|nr:hypothetical protein [Chloroflexota bacterium]